MFKLKKEKALEAFQKDLSETINGANDDSINIDEKYALFVKHIKENAKKHFQVDKNKNRKRKGWLTDDILKIADQKSVAFVNWQNHCGTNLETQYRNKYRRLRKLAKPKIDHRQKEYWDEV